jgi:hypothetical protein
MLLHFFCPCADMCTAVHYHRGFKSTQLHIVQVHALSIKNGSKRFLQLYEIRKRVSPNCTYTVCNHQGTVRSSDHYWLRVHQVIGLTKVAHRGRVGAHAVQVRIVLTHLCGDHLHSCKHIYIVNPPIVVSNDIHHLHRVTHRQVQVKAFNTHMSEACSATQYTRQITTAHYTAHHRPTHCTASRRHYTALYTTPYHTIHHTSHCVLHSTYCTTHHIQHSLSTHLSTRPPSQSQAEEVPATPTLFNTSDRLITKLEPRERSELLVCVGVSVIE